ncbi:acyl-CoA dehydrogenase family protein, partial [Escherichia coli]|nr:acyl-CoA dehydrogenase family protein [Escherichia coli]
AMDRTVDYLKEREQFGRPLSSFQGLQWMLADMETKINASRLLVQKAAVKFDNGENVNKDAAMAKLFAAETAMDVTIKAVQLHGGYGYMKDYPLERMMRDAKITEIYEGTSEVQRMV